MEIKSKEPVSFGEQKYAIETKWLYADSKELVEDKTPILQEITISSQDQLLSVIEKIGQENRESIARANDLDLRIITEKKLIKL